MIQGLLKIPLRLAIRALLLLLTLVLAFHFAVLTGWISDQIVWGGRMNKREEIVKAEWISIAINALLLWLVAQRAGLMKPLLPEKGLRIVFWGMAILFALNTLGNTMAAHPIERLVFTPLTLLLSVLCARLAVKEVKP